MHARRDRLVLLLVCVLPAAAVQAADWPHWRGPTHDGHATAESLVDRFPEGGPPVLWIRDLGQGYSSFAVAGERVYTQTQSLYEQSLVCLDANTGRTIWSYSYGWPYDGGGLYPGPRSTPAVVDDKVYFAAPNGLIGCVKADDGTLVWSVNVNEKFGGRGTDFGYSASPLLIDGLVILPVGGEQASVVALRAADGSTVWKSGTRPASYATPLPITWQGEPLVIALLQNSLACIHRRTGELWWELPMSQGYDEHSAAPLYREPLLVISGPFRSGAQAYRLEKSEDGRCRPVPDWFCDRLSNDVASSVLVEDTIFGFDLKDIQSRLHRPSRGEFRAVDWQTGKVRWSSPEPGHAQIIMADGKLVLFNDRGEVILARASGEEYEELGRAAIFPDEICWTAPALADGRLYLRTQTRAACVYLGGRPLDAASSATAAGDLSPRRRFDPGLLLGGEREYPATLPEAGEFQRWYWWCLGLAAAAAAICVIVSLAAERPTSAAALPAGGQSRLHFARVLFWLIAFASGAAGSAAIHRGGEYYVFTWPLALWVMFALAVHQGWSARTWPFWSWPRARSYLAGIAFIAVCGLYFHLCRWQGLSIEWGFLTGFIGALPAALIAAQSAKRSRARFSPVEAATHLISFSLYYWCSVGFVFWRLGG